MQSLPRLSDKDFDYIYDKVPRLNIDLIIRFKSGGVVLIKRSIEPNIGFFHAPGGTVYKGETLAKASLRIAKSETGLDVNFVRQLGTMEFPCEKRGGITVHTISIVMEVEAIGGGLKKDENAKEIGIFTSLPTPCIKEHFEFLSSHNILNTQ